jgi:hypothetical protein
LNTEIEARSVRRTKPDLSGWLTAAALFWFGAWGLFGLIGIAVLPMLAFMHGTWPPQTWVDGTVARLGIVLLSVGAGGVTAWMLIPIRPRLGASIFSALGLVGLMATTAAATFPMEVLAAVVLWLAWPSVVLLAVWGRRLRPPRAATSQ